MVLVQARQFSLPRVSPSLSSPQITSLLFDPTFLSLALKHSDSSFSLYPSLSPFSLSSPVLPPPQLIVPSPSSSATFLRIHSSTHSSNSRLLFLVSSPLLGGSAVLIRFYVLLRKSSIFARARVLCSQRDLKFDDKRSGVVFDVSHGVSIKLVGSINVFAMYSVSNCKIWLFAVKVVGDEEDDVNVKLMQCAVIDCCVPVFSISVSFGFLILGEENGVRVFPLRPLIAGRVKKQKQLTVNLNGTHDLTKLESQRLKLPNGVIQATNGSDNSLGDHSTSSNNGINGDQSKSLHAEEYVEVSSNRDLGQKMEKHSSYVKLRSVQLKQDCREGGAYFVAFKKNEDGCSGKLALNLAKAISVQSFSPNKCLILDSSGELHILYVSSTSPFGSENSCYMKHLMQSMEVQKLAVLPDISTRAHTVWTSDGQHTLHMMVTSDMDIVNDSDYNGIDAKLMQASAIQAIFVSEVIQEVVPLAANAVLILGQGSIFAYAISLS